MNPTISEIMNIRDLAAYLKLSRSTLYQLSQQGRIPCTKVGKSWRYHKEVIDAWIKDREGINSASKSKTETVKIKILIVDDDEPVLNVLAQSLTKADDSFAVETATDGFQAGQVMERLQPDVVVLDIFLPGIDGYEVCGMIKEGHSDMKVIAITGHGSDEVKQKIIDAGADEYLEKPFDLEELTVQIQDLIERTVSST